MTDKVRPDDWKCSQCAFNNFAARIECKNCATPKTAPSNIAKRKTLTASFAEEQESTQEPDKPAVSKAPVYYLSIDIERVGADFTYGILAIGVCFGKSDGTILEQRAFCSEVPDKTGFESYCWESFWSKHTPILARIHENAMPNHVSAFHDWLLDLEKRYGPFGRKHAEAGGVKLKLITDNPAYDIGMINLEFFKLGHKRPMAEMFSDYVPTDDPSEQIVGMTAEQVRMIKAAMVTPHDHWPVNDATQSFEQRCAIAAILGE